MSKTPQNEPPLGSTLEAALKERRSGYRPYNAGCRAPTQPYDYFLVRPKLDETVVCDHRAPIVVHNIDGKLYTTTNEIIPIMWAINGDYKQGPTDDPFRANLEWCELPQ